MKDECKHRIDACEDCGHRRDQHAQTFIMVLMSCFVLGCKCAAWSEPLPVIDE